MQLVSIAKNDEQAENDYYEYEVLLCTRYQVIVFVLLLSCTRYQVIVFVFKIILM